VQVGARIGLSSGALSGIYGMAETTLGVTVTSPGGGIRLDRVGIEQLAEGRAVAAPGSPEKRVASCGRPYPGFEVLVGSPSSPLRERRVGEVFVKGPSLMRGYMGTEEDDPFVDGWLATGDLGYLADGELFIT